MSLKNQAAEIAQEAARNDRARTDASRRLQEAAAEEYAHRITGVVANFVERVQVAKIASKRDMLGRNDEYVSHEEMLLVRVDDVDLLLRDTGYSYRGGAAKFDVSLGAEHPQHGWYAPALYHHFYRPSQHDSMTDEELLNKFLPALADAQRRAKYEHPIEILQKKGASCPTCGRGF